MGEAWGIKAPEKKVSSQVLVKFPNEYTHDVYFKEKKYFFLFES